MPLRLVWPGGNHKKAKSTFSDYSSMVPAHRFSLSQCFRSIANRRTLSILVLAFQLTCAMGMARPPGQPGSTDSSVRDFRWVAPALTDVPVDFPKRVKDAVTLEPAWEARPGISRQTDTGGTMVFTLMVNHMLPRIANINAQAALAGRPSP